MFRPIRPEDEAIFLQFSEQFYHSPAVLHPIPASYHRATFEELMRSDTYLSCYLFEVNGQPVGYALSNRTCSHETGGPVLWLEELYLLPDYRSRGLGRAMFAYLEQNSGAARIRFEVEPNNRRALALYRALGYQDLDYLQMYKDLSSD